MDELRVAAKRLAEGEFSENYPAFMATTFGLADGFLLARAYLAEHPEDDGEPVTEEWLRSSVGWIPVEGSGYIGRDGIIFCKGSESVYSAWLQISQYYYDMRRIVRVETRGDVRRLCKALGVSLVG